MDGVVVRTRAAIFGADDEAWITLSVLQSISAYYKEDQKRETTYIVSELLAIAETANHIDLPAQYSQLVTKELALPTTTEIRMVI